jgi:hypothetical protein
MRSAPKTAIVRRHLSDEGNRFCGDLGLVSRSLGLVLPIPAKELSMPPQHCVWLHDHQGLLPGTNQPGQQDEKDAIGFRACRPFHLPLEDDQWLSQEGIFGEKLGLASAEVGEGGQWQGGQERFGPPHKARGEGMPAAIQEPLERGENMTHTGSFSIT